MLDDEQEAAIAQLKSAWETKLKETVERILDDPAVSNEAFVTWDPPTFSFAGGDAAFVEIDIECDVRVVSTRGECRAFWLPVGRWRQLEMEERVLQ